MERILTILNNFIANLIYCDILGFLGNMTYTPVAFP
jgi:hypothetical protein